MEEERWGKGRSVREREGEIGYKRAAGGRAEVLGGCLPAYGVHVWLRGLTEVDRFV